MQSTRLETSTTMVVSAIDGAMACPDSDKSVQLGEDVLIDVGASVGCGDVVAAFHGGKLIIRIYEQQGNKSFLVPLNPDYKRIAMTGPCKILGRADITKTGRDAIKFLHFFRTLNSKQKDLLTQAISDLDDIAKENQSEVIYQKMTENLAEKLKAAA